MPLAALLLRGIQNPFAGPPRAWNEVLQGVRALSAARIRREASSAPMRRRALLARAHVEAIDRTSERDILSGPGMSRLADEVGLSRKAIARVALASGRAFRALELLRGHSRPMQEVRAAAWAACFGQSLEHALSLERLVRDHDVLIVGESGTGKERVATAILDGTLGASRGGGPAPRAALNAAAIPESLLESELFGHQKGAFTGATENRRGRIRAADGGCFFLDEVGDVPLSTQVKLLRVIETNHVSPLGSDTGHHVDVRYVAATHRPLQHMIDTGEFRQDLYQRLAGMVIELPPLRDRPEDIVEIGRAFVADCAPEGGELDQSRIEDWLESDEARRHPWPGNVRELENALRSLMLGLPPRLESGRAAPNSNLPARIASGTAKLRDVEQWYIDEQVRRADGNLTDAARRLGVNRATVARRATRV